MSASDRAATAAFDELGRLVLSDHSMESVLQRVADLATEVVPGIAEASISLVTGADGTTMASSGELAEDLDESQYERGYGPCLAAAAGGEVVMVRDTRTERRWAEYMRVAADRGSLSIMSVPVPVQRQGTAALNCYATSPDAFDEQSRHLGTAFAAYAGVAVANMHLYDSTRRLAEQMEGAMRSRAVIDQAKGVIMAQRGCSAQEAFDALVQLSQRSNRKLRDIAQAVVDSVTR